MVAVEFAGFQVDVGFDLGHQFPVFIKLGAQPEFGVEIGIGGVGRGVGAAVVGIDDVIARRCQCGGIALYASGFCKCGG